MAPLLNKLTITVSGSQKGFTQAKLESLITSNGGTFAKAIEPEVTHLITTQADIEKKSVKVLIADFPTLWEIVRSAQAAGLHILSLDWLLKSVEENRVLSEKDYVYSSASIASATTTITAGTPDDNSASQTSSTTPPRRTSKRAASNLKDIVRDEEGEGPVHKKTKAANVKAKGEDDEVMEDVKPVPKKVPAKEGKKEVKDNNENEEDKVVKLAGKKMKIATKGKGKGKTKKVLTPEPEESEEAEEEGEEEVKPKMKTVIKKGKAPVDELCHLSNSAHVYVDSSGVVFDATLNQTDISNNNNKFYYCQLLESDTGKVYSVWVRFGRVGERGQTKMYTQNTSLPSALAIFEKQFRSKTGYRWGDRAMAHGGPKKYAFLERNYEEDEEDEEQVQTGADGDAEAEKPLKSRLAKPLQSLMQLIFNTDIMQQSMASLSYDSNKLPLGKLSKEVISRGYQTLKDIGEVIESRPGYLQKFSEYGGNQRDILNELSNRYYTVIPHSFGRNVPPAINNGQKLKREIELIENLGDMALTTKIMNDTKALKKDDIHPLDKQFDSLGLNEAVPLDKSTTEFKNLEAYVKKTQGQTHYMSLEVEDIFRIARSVEEDHWQNDGWDKLDTDNRHLLWHGSRTTNFAGILSQGLRIAPPEAPVNGYMFGKGIYLADIVSKSAGYCCAGSSNNTGLLLLCEAQLGDPMLELNQADYYAAENCRKANALATKGLGRSIPLKWEDAGVVNEALKGIKMPAVTSPDDNITGDDPAMKQAGNSYRALQYNEYIVYKTSQVKIRYLFRCKFNN